MKKDKTKIKQENLYKRWYRICEPNKFYWFMQIFTFTLYAVLYALMAIFAAKTINCLIEQDWKGAFTWLGVEFIDILLRNIILHIEYIFYSKQYGAIRKNITSKIFDKLFHIEEKGIKKLSAEKIINIAQNNLSYAAEFPNMLLLFCSIQFKSVLLL